MAEKLYLIRVDMERFIGPVSLREVRDSYRRMEFGLQDEIAASNKEWVAFDDLERVTRVYPELAELIKKEMLSGWGSTEPEPRSLPGAEIIESLPRRTFSIILRAILLFMIAASVFATVYVVKEKKTNEVKLLFKDPKIIQAMFYFADSYNPYFEAFMYRNRSDINRSMKKNGTYKLWIPYIRAVAFKSEGRWEGVSFKKLRGKDAMYAPADCSLKTWKTRWQRSRSQWSSFLRGRTLPAQDWAKVLVWDPIYVGQRLEHPGWIEPRNHYEACLKMALKGLEEVSNEREDSDAKILMSRLRWNLSNIEESFDSSDEHEFQMSGSLWSLSCIEDSDSDDSLSQCQNGVNLSRVWKRLIKERSQLRRARMILNNNSALRGQVINDLNERLKAIPNRGYLTNFDYRDEIKFYQLVIDNGGKLDEANAKMQKKNSSLQFLN